MWNSVVIGALVLILSGTRYATPHSGPGLSWTNLILGLWTIASPWVFSYDNLGSSMWNNIATGIAIFLVALWSRSVTAAEARHQHRPIEQM